MSDDNSDTELVKLCLQGNRTCFRHLYRRYQGQVRSTLYQLCGSTQLDDLVQEVFLRAWKGLPKFRQSAKFSTWLYRITWNVATDGRRQFAKRQTQLEALTNTAPVCQEATDLMDLHYRDLVQRGLQELSVEHRAVLILHDLEDVPQKEIAEIFDIPMGTVKSRLFNARQAMRKLLQKQGVQL